MPASYASATYNGDPGVRNPFINPAGPPSGVSTGTTYSANPTFAGGQVYTATPTNATVTMPSPIPARRLFQIPDAYGMPTTYPPRIPPTTPQSNASDSGDPFINVTQTTGALSTVFNGATKYNLNNGYPNLVWSGNVPLPPPPAVPATGVYLGSNNGTYPDNSQHPYWRSEMMQKVMNLTTVRTHQYAVWITIGFFEVTRQGDLGMIQQGNPLYVFDILGPEIGAATGQTTRYRGFFLVDRTKLTGFDDTTPGSFQPAVLYRQMIE